MKYPTLAFVIVTMWTYAVFRGNLDVMTRFISELSSYQQQMAKVTCGYDDVCLVFYPENRRPSNK